MATSLKTRKGVLTRYHNSLVRILNQYVQLGNDLVSEEHPASTGTLNEIQKAEVQVKSIQIAYEKALYGFTEAVDNLEDPLTDEEQQKITEYIKNAEEVLADTEELLMKMEANKQYLSSQPLQQNLQYRNMVQFELPKVPIPEFSGKQWEWENFWQLFNATVHSLPLPELQKFNFLLRALKGEARASIARFQITSSNYGLAIAHLQEKYGNNQKVVTTLHRQLENLNARSTRLKDQRALYDQLAVITAQLQSKGEPMESPWLLSKILSKFKETIQRRVLREKVSFPNTEPWTLNKLMITLDAVIKQEEEIEEQMPRETMERQIQPKGLRTMKRSPFCFYCDSKEHWPVACTKISSPRARLDYLKKSNRCIGCGSKNHVFTECHSKGCLNCGKKHHTSTCFKSNATTTPKHTADLVQNTDGHRKKEKHKGQQVRHNFVACNEEVLPVKGESECLTDQSVMTVKGIGDQLESGDVFLLTGTLQTLHPRTQKLMDLNVLLDTGADRSFIGTKLAEDLELPSQGTTAMELRTFGSQTPKYIQCNNTYLNVWDAYGEQHKLHLYTHENLTMNFSGGKLDEKDMQFIRRKRIKLSTNIKRISQTPTILIGCDQLWKFIRLDAPHYTLPSGLILVPTRLGYMVSGKRLDKRPEQKERMHSSVQTIQTIENDHWERHWETDSCEIREEFAGPEKEEKAKINAKVLEAFNCSIERRGNGYFVRLPFKEKHEPLPDNRALALHRLHSVLRKYEKEPKLLQQYDEVFRDQLRKNILEEVDETTSVRRKHYLPHQPVITPEKDTTKFRVVFDASAHFKNCPSLNDVLNQGPTMLPEIYGILLRFRTGKHVLIADVEKAFLQVHLHEDDRDFTRCMWIRDINKPLSEDNLVVYRFTRVTFGINASPFLLSATILFHLNNSVENKTLASEIAANLYVDNLFVSANTIFEGVQKYKTLKTIFNDINMNLRAFISNSEEIMNAIPSSDKSSNLSPKVLGVRWEPNSDTFILEINLHEENFISKRTIAQRIASIYDPFGWFIPLLVKAKHLQQRLWKEHYNWDEPVNDLHRGQWADIASSISGFRKQIPRKVADSSEEFTLVTYSDASAIAMTACTYIATNYASYFLMAKSKVTDSRHVTTVPKLEMNAFTIAARLTLNTLLSLRSTLCITKVLLLTDSEIVLKWLKSPSSRQSTGIYVSNRIQEVYKIASTVEELKIKVELGYIDTKWNPADVGTRGTTAKEFTYHIWWKGYSLAELSQNGFTSTFFDLPKEQTEEIEEFAFMTQVHTTETNKEGIEEIIDVAKYSSKTKILRILAYSVRLLRNLASRLSDQLRSKIERKLPSRRHPVRDKYLSAEDIRDAHQVLISNHQAVHLSSQYRKELYQNLNLKQDSEQIYRAYGRLNNSELNNIAKNPPVIVPNTDLSRLIILDAHGTYHKSTAQTMAEVRQNYWIPRLRQQVKRCIRSCVACQKMNNLPYKYPELTDLPTRRVTRSRPFQHIGLDYFGPLPIYEENKERTEVYGCIFTCSVTRLIHLEVVSDGTTEKFLNAFRRFVARRGKPLSVISDNAPTFLLGSQIINDCLQNGGEDIVQRSMSNQLIEWRQITPYSPWKGGFYERLIKSVKHALFKATGKRILTRELLYTFLTEVEGCINSRPLTYQENNIDDALSTLRPIDFIQREMDITLPFTFPEDEEADPSFLPTKEAASLETRLQAQNALQSSHALTERYWELWKNQYLTALREQHRWTIDNKRGCMEEPREGQVVLVSDLCQKRNQWKMARIIKLITSSDGAIREAEIVCNKKTLRRPINHLIPLEIGGNEDSKSNGIREEDKRPHQKTDKPIPKCRYNLRPRKSTVNAITEYTTGIKHSSTWPASMYLKMALALILTSLVNGQNARELTAKNKSPENEHIIECTTKGIYLHAPKAQEYELCVNRYCIKEKTPPLHKTLHIPPEELLHEYEARWKLREGDTYLAVETRCPAQSFCASIDCIICSANIMNPECWPLAAILGLGASMYLLIALCYTICYVPITIGRPCRLLANGACSLIQSMLRCMMVVSRGSLQYCIRKCRRRRPTSILQALALLAIAHELQSCQMVNVFPHHLRNCQAKNGKTACEMEIAAVAKINPFKKDVCLKFQKNDTIILKIRVQWEGLRLQCHPVSLLHTRDIEKRVIDSKRCPHMGSCTGNKCADVNSTSLLPELAAGNIFPGTTGCIESCGGPGCDCFYLSSGCLFYRIFAVPKTEHVYELLKCKSWSEDVKIRIDLEDVHNEDLVHYVISLRPNVPVQIGKVAATLSVISIPPLPVLEQIFITTGNQTSIWNQKRLPELQCASFQHAKELRCTLENDCECLPAESQVKCKCESEKIRSNFLNIENVLPTSREQVRFSVHSRYGILARIDTDISAEIILNVKEAVDTLVTEVKEDICTVKSTQIVGCYRCDKGASAIVECKSTSKATTAEIDCGVDSFTVPCSPAGQVSRRQFLINHARVQIKCSVKCGSVTNYFEITGILKYIYNLQGQIMRYVQHRHNNTSEFQLPDIGHVIDIYMQWYKTLLLTIVTVAIAVLLSYLYITTACGKLLRLCVGILIAIFAWACKVLRCTTQLIVRCVCNLNNATKEKTTEKLL